MTIEPGQNCDPPFVTDCNVTQCSPRQAAPALACDVCGGTGYLWLNHLRRLPPCPVCRSAGVVADTEERRQARAERERLQRQEQHEQLRDIVFGHYGRSCACCGTTERLTIDHVNGDGKEHRAEIAVSDGGGGFYHWLIRNDFPDGLQTLCGPCNTSKSGGERCRRWHEKGKRRR